ncbi:MULTISPECIES: carbohydrate kinase [unclassified Paenibacillus]|uniref:carbohydrate kinase n=1 Tax=unclassified Paenibacillus TaxID=185978 RepID=UPI000884C0A5|nr:MULTISPECIES: carbohydrate kinase [unclassified Paenibacillus]SDM26640.1 pseudouridine kinase [Paenibacillus sp. OK060]SHN85469.1 pseudouridine kinase [Paenibacillus sp. ov031]SLK19461.1 pseudouridine kinase [Paenibacillus sp. RU5A]SOC75757.1 pseudouridine kinase [Paenibacillus sp. RU26A]SOC77643.1 pseudouridine kinase [Paenibacillus sp. RU5M]
MDKEKQILDYIKMNPYISQQELSAKVGLSRPTVANYIASLTRRGEIKGRAYILREDSSVVCIGGANIDKKARSNQMISYSSSNPVKINESCGGAARNVAENLSRLNCNTSIMTCVGDDKEGDWILNEIKSQGVDVSQVWVLPTERTGIFITLLDPTGESVVSMDDMQIYEKMTTSMFEEKWSYIVSSQAVFMDTNIPKECISYIIKRCADEHIPLYIDPTSAAKAQKLPFRLDGVELLLPNRVEAEVLADMRIDSIEDCQIACEKIRERGVKQVMITLGDQGAYYSSSEESGHLPAIQTDIVDTTGVGDAFSSCAIYGIMNNESLHSACQLGLAGAVLTLQTEESICTSLKPEKIHEVVQVYSR